MKDKISVEQMNYIEHHLFDNDLGELLKGKRYRNYIERAKKLPYDDMINFIDTYIADDENDCLYYLASIACKYNSTIKELLGRLKEVSKIRSYRNNQTLKLKK